MSAAKEDSSIRCTLCSNFTSKLLQCILIIKLHIRNINFDQHVISPSIALLTYAPSYLESAWLTGFIFLVFSSIFREGGEARSLSYFFVLRSPIRYLRVPTRSSKQVSLKLHPVHLFIIPSSIALSLARFWWQQMIIQIANRHTIKIASIVVNHFPFSKSFPKACSKNHVHNKKLLLNERKLSNNL